MNEILPGTKGLVKTWIILMALTLLSMWSAQLDSHAGWLPLPIWGVALVLIIAGFKVQQILMVYLNLRVSSRGWKSGFTCLLTATVLLVFLAYLSTDLT